MDTGNEETVAVYSKYMQQVADQPLKNMQMICTELFAFECEKHDCL